MDQYNETKIKDEVNSAEEKRAKHKHKGKIKRIFIIISCIFVLILCFAGVYTKKTLYYKEHFLPNTRINGMIADDLSAKELVLIMDAPVKDYKLTVTGRGYQTGESGQEIAVISAEDIGLTYENSLEAAVELLEQQNEWRWGMAHIEAEKNYRIDRAIVFDRNKVNQLVAGWKECNNENVKPAEDAYIDYDENEGYIIIPEEKGAQLLQDKVTELLISKIEAGDTLVDLEQAGCYVDVKVKSDDLTLNKIIGEANLWLMTEITYDWNGNTVVLNKENIKDWIEIGTDKAELREDMIADFVAKQAKSYDTYGKHGVFKTALGAEISLKRETFGWLTNQEEETKELIQLIREGKVTSREPVYANKGQWKGTNDIGNTYVEADLVNQHLYIFQNGEITFESAMVSGSFSSTPDCITPEGIFGLLNKNRNLVLRGEDYEDFVYYWMRYYRGYGLHDATWRDQFGGDIYLTNGSHGCLNLPLESAAVVYDFLQVGTPIIVYYYPSRPTVPAPVQQ